MVFHISIWGTWSFVSEAEPTKAPYGDGTVLCVFCITVCCFSPTASYGSDKTVESELRWYSRSFDSSAVDLL